MKYRLLLVLLFVLYVLALSLPLAALAQDSPTPDVLNTPAVAETPVPDVEPPVVVITEPPFTKSDVVLVVVLLVVTIIVIFFGRELISVARWRYEAQPPFVRDTIRLNATRGLDELQRRAAGTATPIDDELAKYLKEFVLTDLLPEIVAAVQNAPKRE